MDVASSTTGHPRLRGLAHDVKPLGFGVDVEVEVDDFGCWNMSVVVADFRPVVGLRVVFARVDCFRDGDEAVVVSELLDWGSE